MNTASALKNVCASLYGTSSYNNDFTSTLINSTELSHQNHQHALIQRQTTDSLDILTLHKGNIQPPKNEEYRCGKCEFCTEGSHLQIQKEERYEDQDGLDDSCSSCDSSGEEEESCSDDPQHTSPASHITSTTHGHMISIPPCSNVLPSHVTVTSLSELPSHFRRVTTKYTRNRCPLFPCHVPHYLLRKHQLLPSIMAAIPPFSGKRSGQHAQLPGLAKDTSTMTAMNYRQNMSESLGEKFPIKDRQPSAMTQIQDAQLSAVARDTAGIYHTNFDGSGDNTVAPHDIYNNNCLPDLVGSGQEADKNGDAKGGAKSDQNGPRHHHHPHKHHYHHQHGLARKLPSKAATQLGPSDIIFMQLEGKGHMRRHSHVIQHLGQTFKTQAHTR